MLNWFGVDFMLVLPFSMPKQSLLMRSFCPYTDSSSLFYTSVTLNVKSLTLYPNSIMCDTNLFSSLGGLYYIIFVKRLKNESSDRTFHHVWDTFLNQGSINQ